MAPKSAQPSAPTDAPLFREAALARISSSAWQPALLSKPVSGYLLAACAILAGLGLGGFATTFEFARKEQVQGFLTPASGWARIRAKSSGVVRRRFVTPGDLVQSGDVLLEVSSGDGLQRDLTVQEQMLAEIQGRRAALQARLELLGAEHERNLRLLTQQNMADRKKLSRLNDEVGLSQVNVRIAQKRRRDGQRLVSSGFLSWADLAKLDEELRLRMLSLSQRQGEVEQLWAALTANETRLETLALERDLKQAQIKEQLHALAMDESRLRNEGAFRYLAPRSGAVASVQVRAGDAVQPGKLLLDIVPPEGELEARLFAPPAAMGFVAPGQEVRIYLDAFPYERHGAQAGLVKFISETAIEPNEWMASRGMGGPAYRIDVALPNGFALPPAQLQALRPGMTVAADLVRDYGTLVDWLLEPLQGAVKRL